MEIAFIVVAGIVVLSVVTMVGDYLTKTKVAKLASNPEELQALKTRVALLEGKLQDQEAKLSTLESDVTFTNKLLEKRDS